MDYREEMKRLRDTLNAHGYRYYVLVWRIWSGSIRRRLPRTPPPSGWEVLS